MKTQRDLILKHLKSGRPITALGALSMFGCLRLAARIKELRVTHPIKSRMVKRGGKMVAEYTL